VTDGALRIVVLGYVVRGPLGGLAWHHLQYALGLARLGHDVWFVEDSDDYPSCYDPVRNVTDTDPSYGLGFARRAFGRLGLGDRWAFHDAHRSQWAGPAARHAPALCRSADLVLNLSGVNPLRPWLEHAPARALVDTDPAFTQIRHLTDPAALEAARGHTAFLSFGENIASGTADIPADGLAWHPTRQPVVVDRWPVTPGPTEGALTTVMSWESYPALVHEGRHYGMKSASFAEYMALPHRVAAPLEIALGGPNQPRAELTANGWRLRDPRAPTRDPFTFQRYVRDSKAEFSVAKHGYVVTNSGWFSERTTSYLASGRPAAVQDTGFTEWLECGTGVLAFSSADEAAAAIEDVEARYAQHSRAARELVAEHFAAERVLGELVERATAGVAAST
jgi:hypothetical protein